jgi:hypothetical protein
MAEFGAGHKTRPANPPTAQLAGPSAQGFIIAIFARPALDNLTSKANWIFKAMENGS